MGLLAAVLVVPLLGTQSQLSDAEDGWQEVEHDLSGLQDSTSHHGGIGAIEHSKPEEIAKPEWAYTLQLIDAHLRQTALRRDSLMKYMYEAGDYELAQQLLQSYHQVDKLYQTMYLVRTNYAVAGIEQSVATFGSINQEINKSIAFFKQKQQTIARIAGVVSLLEQIIKLPILQVKSLPAKPMA